MHIAEVKSGHLCQRCRSAFDVPVEDEGNFSKSWWSYDCEVMSTIQNVKDMALCGCYICYRMLRFLEAQSTLKDPLRLKYTIYRRYKEIFTVYFHIFDYPGSGKGPSFDVRDMSHFDNATQTTVTGSSTGSEESMQFILQQLQHCDREHSKCCDFKPKSSWYPTRVVDVGLSGNTNIYPRLILTSETPINGPYISLSHCWGDVKPLTLTNETLDQFLHGINPKLLPATFSEAFIVTRKLGVRYIWIDSLCIIQNSDTDWKTESSMMLQVYRHAYCNIAATDSLNSQQGLFRSRQSNAAVPVVISLERSNGLATDHLIYNGEDWRNEIDNAPLNRRAWVTQERFISHRIIHFTHSQVYWDCYQSHGSETCPPDAPQYDMFSIRKDIAPLHIFDRNWKDALENWQKIVKQYTRSAFTYPEKDKIVAISGLVQYLQKSWKIEYYAGLWDNHMEAQLLWYVPARGRKPTRDTLRAPSWSWLCTDGEVAFNQWRFNADIIPSFSIVGAHVSQSTSPKGNIILVGHLMLRCILHEFHVIDKGTGCSVAGQTWRGESWLGDHAGEEQCGLYPDYGEWNDWSNCTRFFILIGTTKGTLAGLVVTLTDPESGSYSRCGVAYLYFETDNSEDGEGGDVYGGPVIDLSIFASTAGVENLPCVKFDTKKGHLIQLV